MRSLFYFIIAILLLAGCRGNESSSVTTADTTGVDSVSATYAEKHRPQLHFSPPQKWMNDPNGMVYHKGEYHLFYQHYPEGNTWGPMHWGHAVSKDLVHWTNLPIAIYPDSLGLIFSGSAVVDEKNTSGFGSAANPPLVAIYTYHSVEKEKAGRTDYQYQGIAYSTDDGRNWKKYENNPVLKNQGVKDFRDPKVFWHDETKKWVMILAVKDHTELWGSANLKDWKKLSEFGFEYGGHGGVWECPDLLKLNIEGSNASKWVMIVSINPGGPNGGSATQYFTGDFDGTTFKADRDKKTTLWLDYGPDDYAGITWSNAPDGRKIFFGWMSNWAYAQEVPTTIWRSANTLPRDLSLVRLKDGVHLRSSLSKEVLQIADEKPVSIVNLTVTDSMNLNEKGIDDASLSMVKATTDAKDFAFELSNSIGQKLIIGYDAGKKEYYIDRGRSGKNDFSKNFLSVVTAPRISSADKINITFVVDVSSIEVFFDDGLTVLTSLYFPDEKLSKLSLKAPKPLNVEGIEMRKMNSIWE